MADNLTHSWSDTRTTAKNGINSMIKHNYTFAGINDSVASVIPPYSQINSATLEGTADKDPNGQTKSGNLYIGFQNTNSSANLQFTLDRKDDLTYKSVESITGIDILSYIKSKTSNAGYIEHSDYNAVRIWAGFTAIYKQGWVTTAKITWNYNEPRAIVTVSGGSGGGTYAYESSIKLTANSKTGYTHSGWSCSNGKTYTVKQLTDGLAVKDLITAYETNLTFTPTYTENKYTIAFNGNGNTGGSMSSLTNVGYDDSKTLTANAFTKTGYTFNGWNTKADGSGTSYADKASVSKLTATNGATVTLYAKWKANSYTIKFNANGGSGSMSDLAMTYGTAKNLTANSFTRTGYTFLGWSTSSTATTATYADKASVNNLATSGTVTLYAVWKIQSFAITVVASPTEGGTISGGGTFDYNKTATLTATANAGWKFKQWNDGNTSNPRTVTVTGAATYTATFEKLTYTLTVTAGTGGTVSGGGSYTYGSTATLKATPSTGYRFVKWSDGNTSATRTVTVTGAATYTATFEKLKYTVTWKNDDGTVLETDNNVEYGTTPTYNGSTPIKASTAQHAYTFSGWSPAISAVTGNVTYTAQFTATVRKYTVKWYNYDGTLLETDTDVPYGTKPTYNGATPTKPSDDYYTYGFAGWSPSITEGIQGDKNFTAQFAQTDRYYTVRWVNASAVQGVEGALLETDEVKFNTQPDYNGATPKHPKQDTDPALNYDFIGWSAKVTDPAKPDTELEKVKGDITYTAIYETTPKLYAVTVVLFDSQSTVIYEYGTEITIEAPEIVDFHRFVKWSDGDTRRSRPVMVTGEATYQAVYERIPIPIKANLEQVTDCYIIPTTKTIVYVISGTVPTVKIDMETVNGWSFLVSNEVPENGYQLEKLFITDQSGITTRVY